MLSRGLLRRALLFHALVGAAVRLGWEVAPYPGVGSGRPAGIAITIGDPQYPVEIHELVETLSLSNDDGAASRKAGMSEQRVAARTGCQLIRSGGYGPPVA